MARTYAKSGTTTKLSIKAPKLGATARASLSTIANPPKSPATNYKKVKTPDILDDPLAFASFGRTAVDGEN